MPYILDPDSGSMYTKSLIDPATKSYVYPTINNPPGLPASNSITGVGWNQLIKPGYALEECKYLCIVKSNCESYKVDSLACYLYTTGYLSGTYLKPTTVTATPPDYVIEERCWD